MTREALDAVLTDWETTAETRPWTWYELVELVDLAVPAARKQLALMPEKCGTCGGTGSVTLPSATEREYLEGLREDQCPRCRNGKVYPQETVETIAKVLFLHDHPGHDWESLDRLQNKWLARAVAVLDALGETE